MPSRDPLAGDDLLHVRLLLYDHMTIERTWNTRNVRSAYWRFYVNSRSGASVGLADGSRYPLVAGRIHFIPAWLTFSCHNHEPIRHLYAHFDLVGMPGAMVREAFPRPLTLGRDRGLEDAAARLAALIDEDRSSATTLACEVKAVVYRALAQAFAGLPREVASRCLALVQGRGAVVPALRHIEDHLPEPLSNASLAAICRLSEDHFIKQFRSHVGQTPAQFILERRIAQAAQRLLFSDDGIDAIAEQGGFANRFYFTRMFTKRMGVSPAAYRKTATV